MKRKIISSCLVICMLLFTFSALFSCEISSKPRLDTPIVTLTDDTITWLAVSGADGYEIESGSNIIPLPFNCLEYKLEDGESVRVRATTVSDEYRSSAWTRKFTYSTDAHTEHTDIDEDGYCDVCMIELIIVLDFYAINDIHGKFCDNGDQVGVDELATYLKNAKKNDEYSILLSSGDMWQGSAESNLTGGFIITEWMNELGFASMTLGNHEFDWGEDKIRENLEISDFPFLAINVYDKDTDKRADYCTPSVYLDYDEIQIGIIGAIGDCYSSISSDMVEGVYFKTGTELTALVTAEAEALRARGADVIIYSLHDGYESSYSGIREINSSNLASYYSSQLADYVDVVFEGHTHKSYVLHDSKDIYHLQGGGENRGLSHVELNYYLTDGRIEVTTAEIVSSSTYRNLDDDPATEELEDKYGDVIDAAYSTLGRLNKKYGSSELSSLVAELYLEAAYERWGNEYDIFLGGGYINTRSPYELSAGPARYADVLSIFPFNNRLVLCSIRGSDLLSKFINNSSYYIHLSDYGEDMIDSISSNAVYYVVVDTYTQLYAPNRLTAIEYYDDGVYARDLLADAIKAGRLGSGNGEEVKYVNADIATLLSIGANYEANDESKAYYCVSGRIVDTPNSRYGNLTLADEDGNQIFVYGLYDEDGNRYEYMSTKPQKGDVITVYAKLYYYVNPNDPSDAKLELKNAVLVEN